MIFQNFNTALPLAVTFFSLAALSTAMRKTRQNRSLTALTIKCFKISAHLWKHRD
jgi:hypothetical protein